MGLCSDGTLISWGTNGDGQLGNQTTAFSRIPVSVDQSGVLLGKKVIGIAASEYHSLALSSDGMIAAWGSNSSAGRLGNGRTDGISLPVLVDNSGVLAGRKVVAIAAGSTHNLALCSDGTLAAWGLNFAGQLGDRSYVDSLVPIPVDQTGELAGKDIIEIACGQSHSMALCSDGTLVAWGGDLRGALGDFGSGSKNSPVIVRRQESSAFAKIFSNAAADHNLALLSLPQEIPDIQLSDPLLSSSIPPQSNIVFDSSTPDAEVTRRVRIRNNGEKPLGISDLAILGSHSQEFTIVAAPSSTVSSGGETEFSVLFHPEGIGTRSAVLEISSNDPTKSIVPLYLVGHTTLHAVYNNENDIPANTSTLDPEGN